MITVKKLKEELEKFKDTDLLFAYEGEVIGLIIQRENTISQGFIPCSESNEDTEKTEIIEQ